MSGPYSSLQAINVNHAFISRARLWKRSTGGGGDESQRCRGCPAPPDRLPARPASAAPPLHTYELPPRQPAHRCAHTEPSAPLSPAPRVHTATVPRHPQGLAPEASSERGAGSGARHDMVWHGTTWYGMAHHGTAGHGTAQQGSAEGLLPAGISLPLALPVRRSPPAAARAGLAPYSLLDEMTVVKTSKFSSLQL